MDSITVRIIMGPTTIIQRK